jgi:hypothetical protein
MVPDESHDWHVRHYGRDIAKRLESVGFEVTVETWLLDQDRNELLARSAYPMRMYSARKLAR